MNHATANEVREYFKNRSVTLKQAYQNMRRKGFTRKMILENFECGVLCGKVLDEARRVQFS